MSIKDTKLWKTLRNLKEQRFLRKRYSHLKKMPQTEYEDFVCKLYAEKFDRFDFCCGLRMNFEKSCKAKGKFENGEIGLPMTNSKLVLPCGIYGRWES